MSSARPHVIRACAVALLATAHAAAAPRVVSLHDVTTEVVVKLGLTDRLAGIGEPVDLPPDVVGAVAATRRVGGLEAIMAVRPTVVLGMGVVAEQDGEMVARLRREGVDVYLPDPATLEDVYELVAEVAKRAGAKERGDAFVSELRRRVEGIGPGAAPTGKVVRAPRVFVYDCCDPPFTAGGKTVLTDLIRRAGGRNVFDDVDADWMNVSWEEVVARRPDVIVIHSYRWGDQGDIADKEKAVRALSSLSHLPVVVMPLRFSLGGLGSLEGLAKLSAELSVGAEAP